MDPSSIEDYITKTFDDVNVIEDDGNWFFLYDTHNRIPFATIVTSDKYDSYSDLSRPGVFRLNIGTGKETYRSMFSVDVVPAQGGYDFTTLDIIMPHPEYGRIYWVCVLNPSPETFVTVEPMLAEAYALAVKKYQAARSARPGRHAIR